MSRLLGRRDVEAVLRQYEEALKRSAIPADLRVRMTFMAVALRRMLRASKARKAKA